MAIMFWMAIFSHKQMVNFYPRSILCNKHVVNTYYVLGIGNLKVKNAVSHSHGLSVQITGFKKRGDMVIGLERLLK